MDSLETELQLSSTPRLDGTLTLAAVALRLFAGPLSALDVFGRRQDDDWAGRVLGALLADRAEQEPGEAASATGADDEQLGAPTCANEGIGRRPLERFRLDLDPVRISTRSRQRLV